MRVLTDSFTEFNPTKFSRAARLAASVAFFSANHRSDR
jgi:hypothetical protein